MNQHKVAIVTGAGGGVGQAAAVALAHAGYALVLVGRTQGTLDATAARIARITGAGPVLVCRADVTDAAAVDRLVRRTLERFESVDAVANVAGTAPRGPIERITPKAWRQCIDTNLSSIVYMTRALWPHFQQHQNGHIVNISSMASIDPFPGFAMYAAAKVGVNMFTRCTGQEGRKIGVRAVALVLGAVETPMLRSLFSEKSIPPEKAYAPRSIGQVICDCITGKRDFENGQTIVIANP